MNCSKAYLLFPAFALGASRADNGLSLFALLCYQSFLRPNAGVFSKAYIPICHDGIERRRELVKISRQGGEEEKEKTGLVGAGSAPSRVNGGDQRINNGASAMARNVVEMMVSAATARAKLEDY